LPQILVRLSPKLSLSAPGACGLGQIRFAGDVVPVEDGTGLVSRDLHGHGFGNTGPVEIPHGGTSHVVRNTAWAASRRTSLIPARVEALDRLAAAPAEHMRRDDVFGFQCLVARPPRIDRTSYFYEVAVTGR
jgi:hypothetical protein